jgi:hypothetical protein
VHPKDAPVEAFECDDCLRQRQQERSNVEI